MQEHKHNAMLKGNARQLALHEASLGTLNSDRAVGYYCALNAKHVGSGRSPRLGMPRGEREREREGPRMRVTTVRFGAPRSQAAGCIIRLQLPPGPSTRAGGGQRAPPPGEGNEKVRDVTQGGKKILTVAAQIPAREGVRPVARRAVLCGTALWAAAGEPTSTFPP